LVTKQTDAGQYGACRRTLLAALPRRQKRSFQFEYLPLHEGFLETRGDADLLIGFSTERVGGQKDASIIEPHNLKLRDFDPCDTTLAVGREVMRLPSNVQIPAASPSTPKHP